MLTLAAARYSSDGSAIRYVTSGFADDVMFSHNGANVPEWKPTLMFRTVRQVAAPGTKFLSTIVSLSFVCVRHYDDNTFLSWRLQIRASGTV